MSEDQLQQQCVVYFNNTYKEYRGRLFRTENKTNRNAKGLGLVRGVSDLQFVNDEGRIIPLECKVNGSRHEVLHLAEQLYWSEKIKELSGLAFFFFSFNQFKEIVDKLIDYNNNELWLLTESKMTMDYIHSKVNGAVKMNAKTVILNY